MIPLIQTHQMAYLSKSADEAQLKAARPTDRYIEDMTA
jgi:hypothetical protein